MKSSSKKVVASAAFVGLVAGAYPVAAHHSTTMFDREKFIVLEGTVKLHLHHIYGKLGISSRAQLIMMLAAEAM